MQKNIISILLLFFTLMASAQEEKQSTLRTSDHHSTLADSTSASFDTPQTQSAQLHPCDLPSTLVDTTSTLVDSTSTPVGLPLIHRPYLFSTWMTSPLTWGMPLDLHKGFNAQIDMGVMVGFGKHNPFKGASFFTDVTLAYVQPLNEHWTVALGGTLSRFKLWNEYEYSADLFALANYRFDDHWSASIYASYNHMPEGIGPYGMYGIYSPDIMHFNENFARIGGEVTYKFNEKLSLSVGLSAYFPTDSPRPWKPQHSTEQRLEKPIVK